MRLFELIGDWLLTTPLLEMAMDRRRAKDKVTDLSPQIYTHLLKLFVVNSPENHHWQSEINAWLGLIDDIRFKHNHKKLDFETGYNWFMFDAAPHYDEVFLDNRIKKFHREGYKLNEVDPAFVLNKIADIVQRVFKDIENNKFDGVDAYL